MSVRKSRSQECSDFIKSLTARRETRTFDELFRRGSVPTPKADRTRRALVRQILGELHGDEGPLGYPDEIVLRAISEKLRSRSVNPISNSTMRRARREKYGWGVRSPTSH
jgi:hypothetical protein